MVVHNFVETHYLNKKNPIRKKNLKKKKKIPIFFLFYFSPTRWKTIGFNQNGHVVYEGINESNIYLINLSY